jgi:hypothetical protein
MRIVFPCNTIQVRQKKPLPRGRFYVKVKNIVWLNYILFD